MFKGINYVYRDFLPSSEYEEGYPFLLQVYSDSKYFGLKDPKSIIDYYIPGKKKETKN